LAILLAIGCGSPDATSKQTTKQASPNEAAGMPPKPPDNT
jgi:hypothetical protein